MRAWVAAAVLGAVAASGHAQFAQVPTPVVPAAPVASEAEEAAAYRLDAARHLYASFPSRVHKGKLPPMMYAVMITEAEVDATGQVISIKVVRPPAAAKEVTPWVLSLIRRAAPFPVPAKMAGGVAVWREIWLVDKTGTFQVDALTEGQR
jgi:hypothetical protein